MTYRLEGGCAIQLSQLGILEQYTGFEPVPSAWKADMLAIEHQYCKLDGLNDRIRTCDLLLPRQAF